MAKGPTKAAGNRSGADDSVHVVWCGNVSFTRFDRFLERHLFQPVEHKAGIVAERERLASPSRARQPRPLRARRRLFRSAQSATPGMNGGVREVDAEEARSGAPGWL